MKRISTLALALLIVFSCGLAISASASTYASKTIASSFGDMEPGDQTGRLDVEFSILSNKQASALGVSNVRIYKMNGERVASINGSVANGLIEKNDVFHMGTYHYDDAVSGQYYYAEITVFATIGSDYDAYTHLTPTVKAP